MIKNIILLLGLLANISCGNKEMPILDALPGISLDHTSVYISVNGTKQLIATISTKDTTDKTIIWSSGDPSVATVSTNGLITGVSPGNATITALIQALDKTATCLITVIEGSSAVSVNDFLNSIGVNSAVSRRGESLQNTINATQYMGVRWFRSGYESDVPVQDLVELHNQTGAVFSYGLLSGGYDITKLIAGARELESVGALLALEGPNEPNNWSITYQDEMGGGSSTTWLPVAKLQRDLYNTVKNDPFLKDYPVWTITESGAEKDNVGLQYLVIPQGAGALMPDGTEYADYANVHNYIYHPNFAGLNDNQVWIAADPTSACKVDGLYGNFGLTWSKKFPGYSEAELLILPRVTTETGVKVGAENGAVTEEIQANNYLCVYLDQFKRGYTYTSIYLLRDRTDESGNQRFGFYNPDYTPRKAAVYLHNLTTIIADNISLSAPGQLSYFIPNQPVTTHDMLLQKSNGRFVLIIWSERVNGSDNITVHFGDTFPSVKIYDPTTGTSMLQSLSNVDQVTLTLSDHPFIIEI